ncbi:MULTISPECIES: hypothetical protein [unclassified Pseudonocardia]|uniref:hypothetical protein n=1 Tax=unclassified Pseudonocardia TaxID=2619320 RepID=UPI000B08D483|nr:MULTISPECIES: hypothetical protein [unclassified Pseudonocardia]
MPSSVHIHAGVDEGLGNSCYLLDLGDGTALVVDPPRDLRAVLTRAREGGLRIRFATETHQPADCLSGAVQLAHDHALPGETAVWPTHGAGSFCSAPPGAELTSTVANELATNPLLALPDEQSFVDALLGSLSSHPGYFTCWASATGAARRSSM